MNNENDESNLTPENVRRWMASTKEGREMGQALMDTAARLLRKEMHVLLVLHPDGTMRIYGDHRHTIHFRNFPWCQDYLSAEEVFENELPAFLKELYYPNATQENPGLVGTVEINAEVKIDADDPFRFEFDSQTGHEQAENLESFECQQDLVLLAAIMELEQQAQELEQ